MRGEVENRIKELFDVSIDRTSCTKFRANQLRVLLAAAAHVLLQELRLAARGTAWARAQVATLRLELLKIGVQLIASMRRLVFRLPAAFPFRDGWRRIASTAVPLPAGFALASRHSTIEHAVRII